MPKSEAPLDVATMITDFLHDPSRMSLELPPMAAGLRKRVKGMADQHPELTCESFGLGMERRTHIFKRGSAAAVTESTGVSVKNTFIDDWISPDDQAALEPAAFRSMPTQLPQCSVQAASPCVTGGMGKLDLSPINEGSPKWPCATFGIDGSPTKLPTLLGGIRVRNTFIHIDSLEPDDRSVRSMPHDMFRQCLEEEATRVAGSNVASGSHVEVPGTPTLLTAPGSPCDAGMAAQTFLPGMQVIIYGLTKVPAFNGRYGIVEHLDQATGRYSVRLIMGGPSGPKYAKLKADNMRLMAPGRLPFAPSAQGLHGEALASWTPGGDDAGMGGLASLVQPLRLTSLV